MSIRLTIRLKENVYLRNNDIAFFTETRNRAEHRGKSIRVEDCIRSSQKRRYSGLAIKVDIYCNKNSKRFHSKNRGKKKILVRVLTNSTIESTRATRTDAIFHQRRSA